MTVARVRSVVSIALLAALLLSVLGSLNSPLATAAPNEVEVRVLTINDFHGRIEAAPSGFPPAAGAAVLAGAVSQIRSAHPNTVFVSAGDNIGASTFTSFIAEDAPTIAALKAATLELSVVGNHEFDRGSGDLRGRVLDLYGESWYGLGANVYLKGTKTPVLDEYRIVDVGGFKIGFIGTVTEQTATSVTPQLVADLDFGSQLEAVNRAASAIDALVDATVLLTHDGSFSSDCSVIAGEQSTFGQLIRDTTPLVDGIVSGHTHTAYNCEVGGRPVLQSGHYGSEMGELELRFDGSDSELLGAGSSILPLTENGVAKYPSDPGVQAIVDAAVEKANELGARKVGSMSEDILRGGMPVQEDRGVESALGNLVADVMLDALRLDGTPMADLAVMNPGGLRTDLKYGLDGTVTYRDAASVLPFANSIFTVELTGAQLKRLLEQQWYLSGTTELKRHLGVSEGFSYTYMTERPLGDRVTAMTLHGAPIDPAGVYTVASHTFLVGGGDGFSVFTEGSGLIDTGRNDLQILVEYFEEHQPVRPPLIGRAIAESVPPAVDPVAGPEEIANTGAAGSPVPLLIMAALLTSLGLLTRQRMRPRRTE